MWKLGCSTTNRQTVVLESLQNLNMGGYIQGVSKKTQHKVLCSTWFTTPAMNVLENWVVVHIKGEIHSFVLSTEQFLSYSREMRYLAPKFGFAWNSLSLCIIHTPAPNRSSGPLFRGELVAHPESLIIWKFIGLWITSQNKVR